MAREIYTIRWRKDAKVWVCVQFNSFRSNKAGFVRHMARQLRRRWQFAHVRCQLRVYGKNGRIQFERTYGRDPRRFPG